MIETFQNRPGTIAEIAQWAKTHSQRFDASVREFLDQWQSMPQIMRAAAIAQEPASIGVIQDAYLAGLAEHLALSDHMEVPEWVQESDRFLDVPFFAGGLESLKAILLVESPLAFRRRLIFISADALSRPLRKFNASNAAINA
ncbi:MAG TPA: hypothetical protein VK779_12230 [Rhizomicrobium sp.]|jgi:hypothetical protein|nr:hypothetical protein [Rhizomicrobium sp.]